MKLLLPVKLILAVVCLTGAIAMTGLIQGCGTTTPVEASITAEKVTIPTVNAAMTAWKDWVVAGNATQAQVDAVKASYAQYYNSQLIASNAFAAYFAGGGTNQATAQAALYTILTTATTSQTNIIWLIQSFTATNK